MQQLLLWVIILPIIILIDAAFDFVARARHHVAEFHATIVGFDVSMHMSVIGD